MQMYSNTAIYLCNAILVTEIFCYWYSTINNPELRNNIFQRNLAVATGIYCELSARNFI